MYVCMYVKLERQESHSFPRYTQKRQTIAHEKQLLINQLFDDIPTSYT